MAKGSFAASALILFYLLWVIIAPNQEDKTSRGGAVLVAKEDLSSQIRDPGFLVLGGSAATYGLSAAMLSGHFSIQGANLALPPNGGHNFRAYTQWLEESMSRTDRESIGLIVIEPIQLVESQPEYFDIAGLDTLGRKVPSFYMPKSSPLQALQEIFGLEESKFSGEIVTEMGDLAIPEYELCSNPKSREFETISEDEFKKIVTLWTNFTNKVFPSARIVFVVAPQFYENLGPKLEASRAERYNTWFDEVVVNSPKELPRPQLFSPGPLPSVTLVCNYGHHPNQAGREWVTQQLVDFLDSTAAS